MKHWKQRIGFVLFVVILTLSSPVCQSNSIDYSLDWTVSQSGYKPGQYGLELSTRHLPYPEIIYNVSMPGIYLQKMPRIASIRYNPHTNQYQQAYPIWIMDQLPENHRQIDQFYCGEFNTLEQEILLAIDTERSFYSLWNMQTGEMITSYDFAVTYWFATDLADYTGDGLPELCAYSPYYFFVIDVLSGKILKSFSVNGYSDRFSLSVGQYDSDPSLEAILGSGTIIDLDTESVQKEVHWDIAQQWNIDIDKDGIDELVCVGNHTNDYSLSVHDIDQNYIKWSYPLSPVDPICLCDWGNDGSIELLFIENSGADQRFSCIDGLTGVKKWTTVSEIPLCVKIQSADFDGDKKDELFCITENHEIYIIDPISGQIEFCVESLPTLYNNYLLDDFDNDGVKDLGCLSVRQTGFNTFSSYLSVYDLQTYALKHHLPLAPDSNVTFLRTAELSPVFPGKEYLIITTDNRNEMRLLDREFKQIWMQPISIGLTIVDLDCDGDNELLTHDLDVYSGQWGCQIMSSPDNGYTLRVSDVQDINDDCFPEIAVKVLGRGIDIVDGMTLEPLFELYDEAATFVTFAELLPDTPGVEVVYLNSESELLIVLDGISFNYKCSLPVNLHNITDLDAQDTNNNNLDELIVSSHDRTLIIDQQGNEIWKSDPYYGGSSNYCSVHCDDLNKDESTDLIIVNSMDLMVYLKGDASPAPTPFPCNIPGVALQMTDTSLQTGDPFVLTATLCNITTDLQVNHHLLVALSVGGAYWFLPSWIDAGIGFDDYTYSVPSGQHTISLIREFSWPGTAQPIHGLSFIAALMNADYSTLIGDIADITFEIN